MVDKTDARVIGGAGDTGNEEIAKKYIERGDYYGEASGESAAEHVFLITPHDVNDLAHPTVGISFAAAGALKVDTVGGETVTIPSGTLAAGAIHPLRVTRVYATGTGATGIIGVY